MAAPLTADELRTYASHYRAERSRKAKEAYEVAPVRCLNCGNRITLKDSASETRKRKFCGLSCAATYNNRVSPKRRPVVDLCQVCGNPIALARTPSGSLNHRKLCDTCRSSTLTKGGIFAKCPLHSAHSLIRSHARNAYRRKFGEPVCQACGYTRHVEIIHKKPVKDFPPEARLTEINDLTNLWALCPTHHWEFDHGYLVAETGIEPATPSL